MKTKRYRYYPGGANVPIDFGEMTLEEAEKKAKETAIGDDDRKAFVVIASSGPDQGQTIWEATSMEKA